MKLALKDKYVLGFLAALVILNALIFVQVHKLYRLEKMDYIMKHSGIRDGMGMFGTDRYHHGGFFR